MKTWYQIIAKANAPAEISVYDEIGAWGVTAKSFIADLKALGDVKQITLSINSPGGSVFDALAMFNALRGTGSQITTKVMGIAASAASLLAMAGDKRVMPANAFMMVHNPMNGVFGNAADMRDMADVLDKINASLVATYVARTGRTEAEVKALLDAETWLSADDAVAQGFADEVEPALTVTASYDIDRLPANIQAVFKAAADPAAEAAAAANAAEAAAAEAAAAEAAAAEAAAAAAAATPIADQVLALATAAGVQEFAAHWALATGDIGEVKARIEEAREIKALCALAKRPDDAAAFIHARTSVEKVRENLVNRRAAQDEQVQIETTPRSKNPSAKAAQPEAVSASGIWAARHKASQ
ncbi:Clp protease ClpP [Cupriavidus sp. CV2]|uniref:head maturation protease, ClpP-related n=1 Tax=Cupriavidus ulmosensis TaxID=3065913 RepID=UPI00296AC483|nr:head maturation protease, ClpP-related [Cupriavidus sp. CV2]MDW3682940.1 Clp protease ClpP [Cupriavidus sp. CV2]